jgi:hypothetical protein
MQDAKVPSEVCGKEPLISEKTKEERNDKEGIIDGFFDSGCGRPHPIQPFGLAGPGEGTDQNWIYRSPHRGICRELIS